MRFLVLYTYYETNESKINLHFFINNGLFRSNTIKFIFIIKGDKLSLDIPKYNNVIIKKTPNEGYDFGGWSDGLKLVNINNFDRFIFLNDTVRGPFLSSYLDEKKWVEYFTEFINNKIKLVGSTINCEIDSFVKNKHIQSMSFATDRIGLNLLIKNDIFNKELCVNTIKESKFKFIIDFEVRMSEIIMNQGYEIKSLQFSEQKNDVQYLNRYKGTTINPLEIMFIKTNRINDLIIKNYTEWFLNKNLKKYNIIYFEKKN